jgi:hypothetical protein
MAAAENTTNVPAGAGEAGYVPADPSKEQDKLALAAVDTGIILDKVRSNELKKLGSRQDAKESPDDTACVVSSNFQDFHKFAIAYAQNAQLRNTPCACVWIDMSDTNLTKQGLSELLGGIVITILFSFPDLLLIDFAQFCGVCHCTVL